MKYLSSMRAAILGLTALTVWLSGCTVGPSLLRVVRMGYNEAIQVTTEQQLLLNLVRLKYRDTPLFLAVGSVSAQFQLDESVGLSGELNENVGVSPLNPDSLRLDGRVGFSERPTITFIPLQGDKFVMRLLTPLSLETVVLLVRSGWSIDRVLRLCAQQINNLDNASRASGPTPDLAPRFRGFAEASRVLRSLQLAGALQIGYARVHNKLSPPLEPGSVGAADLLTAAREGFAFQATDAGTYLLTAPSKKLVLQVRRDALQTDDGRSFVRLLGLKSGVSIFDLTVGEMRETPDAGRPEEHERIIVAPRSLMGIFFYLSHAIEVPRSHRESGLVTTTQKLTGEPFDWSDVTGDLLCVKSQKNPPNRASVAVKYRGYWFYIDDADLNSKSTFGLLAQLFALQAGGAEGVGPVLTLPIG